MKIVQTRHLPRLPLEGRIDLTYRCNNQCRHCWVGQPGHGPEQDRELTFDEIRRIADEARALGCRRWSLSGGEPMLRPDFPEIFDYLTRQSISYTLNTNGTLITPETARLLQRKGTKMIALYGATAEVYDHITRHPGGFEQAMRGFRYLREAGASFIVQLIPMRDNFHQWADMIALAQSLSKHWRCGAPWLYLGCDGDSERNEAIRAQRLTPAEILALDKPDLSYEERAAADGAGVPEHLEGGHSTAARGADDRLFARCIAARRGFHVDPYGQMSWCGYIQDPALRYNLRTGSFREAWETFIPACADKIRGGDEWRENCGSCESRRDCRWCAVYARLETGRYSAPIPHLCEVAREVGRYKADWRNHHRRYFRIAGITVRVESDLDLRQVRFKDELTVFAVDGLGTDTVELRHHFELPDLGGLDLGRELYRKPPWAISQNTTGFWFYRGISPSSGDQRLHRVAVFSPDYSRGTIYSPPRERERILREGWQSLSLFPTDQIWLGPLLADRQAVLVHSAAAIVNGRGLVFVGHSEVGKSTTMELLKAGAREGRVAAEVLCDDRNVLRWWPAADAGESGTGGQWRVHGTWSHGTTPDVSTTDAPLAALLFLKQAPENRIEPLTDRKQIWHTLLATLIRPMVTAEWWRRELDVLDRLVNDIPCYTMHFDRTGAIVELLAHMPAAEPWQRTEVPTRSFTEEMGEGTATVDSERRAGAKNRP